PSSRTKTLSTSEEDTMNESFHELMKREIDVALRQVQAELEAADKMGVTTTAREHCKRIVITTDQGKAVISLSIFTPSPLLREDQMIDTRDTRLKVINEATHLWRLEQYANRMAEILTGEEAKNWLALLSLYRAQLSPLMSILMDECGEEFCGRVRNEGQDRGEEDFRHTK